MREAFSEIVEAGRDKTDQRFATRPGSRFGLFRIESLTTGATLHVLVGSAELWKSEGLDGEPWDHVSVSKVDKPPTWEEMCYVKLLFFGDDECVVQFHPPKSQYVNLHPNVLHLWKLANGSFPMPPIECV